MVRQVVNKSEIIGFSPSEIAKLKSELGTDTYGYGSTGKVREMGIPAIVGCGNATKVVKTGREVTICCCEGEEGKVYSTLLPFEVKETALDKLPSTRTKILMNVIPMIPFCVPS